MNGDIRYTNKTRRTFIFHGKGLDYFLISLVNVLLSVITLGVMSPGQWYAPGATYTKTWS
jgi:uncharacterized membrane protein YjgN (DUF898 family)